MSFAKKTGKFFAHVQSAVDDAMTFAFKKLKKTGENPETKKEDPSIKGQVKKGAKGVARFIGEAGESFYETYEKLKKEKK